VEQTPQPRPAKQHIQEYVVLWAVAAGSVLRRAVLARKQQTAKLKMKQVK
jgi:hypothetical protein